MSEKIKLILEDEREIKELIFPNDIGSQTVGCGGIEKIVAYRESCGVTLSPWFAVIVNGKVKYRVNAAHVETVGYKEGK